MYRPAPVRRAAARVPGSPSLGGTCGASSMPSRNIPDRAGAAEGARDAVLIGGHQVCSPEPNRQRELRVVKNRPCHQRYLTPATSTLPASQLRQLVNTWFPYCGHTKPSGQRQADKYVRNIYSVANCGWNSRRFSGNAGRGTPIHYPLRLAETTR